MKAMLERSCILLILVTTAKTGGGVLFSSRRTFVLRKRERDCFSKVYSENIKTNPHFFFMKIPDTPSQVLNTLPHVANTPSQCRRHQIRQPKQQVCPISISFNISEGKQKHLIRVMSGQKDEKTKR